MIRVLLTVTGSVGNGPEPATGTMAMNVVEFKDINDLLVAVEHFAANDQFITYHILGEPEPEMAAEQVKPELPPGFSSLRSASTTLINAAGLMREAVAAIDLATNRTLAKELHETANSFYDAVEILKTYG